MAPRSAPAWPVPFRVVVLAVLALIVPAPGQAQEADSVVLRNGDVLHGEVKELRRGKLSFDTDAMDIVSVDWDDILFLTSSGFFEVTDIKGTLHFGQLSPTDRPRTLAITLDGQTANLPFSAVVEMRGLANDFLSKTSGYVDLGVNLVRANRLRSLLLQWHMTFEGRIWELDIDGDTYHQSQTSTGTTGAVEERTSRNSGTLTGRRFLNGRWAITTSLQTESNEELSLDVRTLLAVGGRYNIVRNQGLEFYTGLSAVYNNERFAEEENERSAEAKLSVGFDMFDVGDLDIYLMLEGYQTPGTGRVRANLNSRIAWEVIDDFTIGLSAVERFDSRPAAGAEKRDFQYGLTLGWTWG